MLPLWTRHWVFLRVWHVMRRGLGWDVNVRFDCTTARRNNCSTHRTFCGVLVACFLVRVNLKRQCAVRMSWDRSMEASAHTEDVVVMDATHDAAWASHS